LRSNRGSIVEGFTNGTARLSELSDLKSNITKYERRHINPVNNETIIIDFSFKSRLSSY
jgi:hypothetical protein